MTTSYLNTYDYQGSKAEELFSDSENVGSELDFCLWFCYMCFWGFSD